MEASSTTSLKFPLQQGRLFFVSHSNTFFTDSGSPTKPADVADMAKAIAGRDTTDLPEQDDDSAAAGTSNSQAQNVPPIANAAKEILNRGGGLRAGSGTSTPGSGASTPSFVRTAAEVADSAALLDKEDPEPEIPDEEAGRIGYRRMSATPISDVANTAAEVADDACWLDDEVNANQVPCFVLTLTVSRPFLGLRSVRPIMMRRIRSGLMSH